MVNKIQKSRVAKVYGSNCFPQHLEMYIEFLRQNKMTDFFGKTSMLIRLSAVSKITLYRCSRWVEKNNITFPEWYVQMSFYEQISSLLRLPLEIRMSVFDLKAQANKENMYLYENKYGYSIVGNLYIKETLTYQKCLSDLYITDQVFKSKLETLRVHETAKFRSVDVILQHFAEVCASVVLASSEKSAVFVHDTRRLSLVRYLERIGLIPKIPFVPLPRRNIIPVAI